MRVLILGGYGTFGGRLAHLLATESRLTLLIAGRSGDKAARFCDRLPTGAAKVSLVLDREGALDARLREISPDVVVDATGPFQAYGDDPYRVVKACIALGINYMDLADGSAFVEGISKFDIQAKARNVYVLSGVSSFPVLTAGVVRRLAQDLVHVTTITAGIAPSPYAVVGRNVLRAIAAYAGQQIEVVREGRTGAAHALTESMRYTVSPPGRLPLRNLRFSLVDVPDLRVLPAQWPGLRSIWIGAGPVPEVLHRMLNGLAWMVRLRLLPSLSLLAPLFDFVSKVVRWGEHRGGMFVSIEGEDRSGRGVERSWHLLAEGNDGPFIPSMAVEGIIRRCLSGNAPAPGARAATRDLELADYEALFAGRTILTGTREWPSSAGTPLYRRILGNAWDRLPVPLQAMHGCRGRIEAMGEASVQRGRGILANMIAFLVGFPPAGKNVPVRVSFTPNADGETWTRTFGEKSFSSRQAEGKDRSRQLIIERFGPVAVGLALVVDDGKLYLVVRRWSFLGVPLPLWFAPGGTSVEFAEGGRFHFDVEIRHPLTGPIVRYRGWLEPVK